MDEFGGLLGSGPLGMRLSAAGAPRLSPNESRGFVHKRIIGAVTGFASGGFSGAVGGFVSGGSSRRGRSPRATDALQVVPVSSREIRRGGGRGTCPADHIKGSDGVCRRPPAHARFLAQGSGGSAFGPSSASARECLPGQLRVGGLCVDFLGTGQRGFGVTPARPPGTALTTTGAQMPTGQAVVGSFGLPAMIPEVVGSIQRRDGTVAPIRRCGARMVLGTDDLCYPKALLPRRSKFRKWRMAPRPVISAGDTKAIRRAGRARDRVLDLAKDVGLFASKTRPKTASKAPPHQHLIAAPSLKVIHEEIG